MHGLDFPECLPEEGIPVVVSLHLPLSWYQQSALRSITPNIHLVCVSKSQAATAMPGVRIDRIIPNGIDLSQFHPSKRKSDYAVVMSRMCPEKGVHLAIEAAERAGVNLIIAGSVFEYREHREYFDSAIAPRLSSRIRFIGPVGGDRKAHLLAGARCLIVPSLAPETSSLVAMEALASATPVIAFPNGAMRELISFGRTGFLVDSVEEMAEAIGKAGQIETQTCRREAEQRFSSESVASHYFDLYSSVLTSESIPELQAA
jgi:glycosyltransferase involved in cell wall biosynthesis